MALKSLFARLRNVYHDAPRGVLVLYLVLRGLVLVCLGLQVFHRNWFDVLLCVLTLFLLILPALVEKTFRVELPSVLEATVLLFVFSAEILGEIGNFYEQIPMWDTVLHTLTGFWAASVGFSLVDLLNRHSQRNHLTPLFVSLVAFCFSMTVGVMWEFFEFGSDQVLHTDMQKDRIVQTVDTVELDPTHSNTVVHIHEVAYTVMYGADGTQLARVDGGFLDIGIMDTMKDLLVNMLGAALFSLFGFLYICGREKYGFVGKLLIRRRQGTEWQNVEEGVTDDSNG